MSTFRAQVLRAPCAAGERPLQAGELDDVVDALVADERARQLQGV